MAEYPAGPPEYKVADVDGREELERLLNREAQEGWQLVGMAHLNMDYTTRVRVVLVRND